MSSMFLAGRCGNIPVIVIKIPPVHIINISISVIVHAVTRHLILIDPNGILKIRMGDIHAGINDRYRHLAAVPALLIKIPGRPRADINS